MDKHEFNKLPDMQPEEYEQLKADLTAYGYDSTYPIITYQGKIIDGWHRYQACEELQIKPVIKEFTGTDTEAIEFIFRSNKRRNLNSSQWAAIATEAKDTIAAIKAAVEAERLRKQKENAANQYTDKSALAELIPPRQKPEQRAKVIKAEREARTKAAKAFNTNSSYLSEAERLKEEKPEVFEQIKSGKKTISEVKKEEKIEKRKADIQAQKEAIEQGKVKLPEGVFEVIVIDPPWKYDRQYDPNGSRIASPYPELSQQELLELKIPAANDCVMFLWTTQKFIWNAKELLDAWSFEFKGLLVWDKDRMLNGDWLRMQCEFCLFGVKGKPTWYNTTYRDIITEEGEEHSRKPQGFFDLIDNCVIRERSSEHSRKPHSFFAFIDNCTVGRKLDYFAREQREGWATFGNDTNKFGGQK